MHGVRYERIYTSVVTLVHAWNLEKSQTDRIMDWGEHEENNWSTTGGLGDVPPLKRISNAVCHTQDRPSDLSVAVFEHAKGTDCHSTTCNIYFIGWIAMKRLTGIHIIISRRINPTNFCNPLTFPAVPLWRLLNRFPLKMVQHIHAPLRMNCNNSGYPFISSGSVVYFQMWKKN